MTATYRASLALAFLMTTAAADAQDRTPPGTVTLSRTDYDRLLDLASRRPPDPDRAPVPAALTRADLKVRVNGSMARATMAIEGQVFHAGPIKVPLIGNATLLDARMGDRPLPLMTDAEGHAAVVTGPAAFSATLEWASPLMISPGRGSFVLPVPKSGSATATIDVPGEMSDVNVSPGLVLRRTSTGGRTVIEATLDPAAQTQVWWSSRETAPVAPPRDTRLLSDVKTLITIGEADVRLLSLINVTVVQGEAPSVALRLPAGYEVVNVSGTSVDRTEEGAGQVTIVLANPGQRRHEFAVALERQGTSGSFRLESGFPSIAAAQRETGEVAIEGLGTMEVGSADVPGLRRVDTRETDPALASAGGPLLAAYRYQRGPSGPPTLALDVTRFADASVLAAVADRATATTLVTSEGRALTEVTLRIRNRAQPFVRVVLPQGATMLSAEVEGQPSKPATGADGTRVPLLRPGFRPRGPYTVSFVYVHAGSAFARRGDMRMVVPRMDLPISIVEWELFVPDQYRADRFGGDAIPAEVALPHGAISQMTTPRAVVAQYAAGTGVITGIVTDRQGAVMPGVTIMAESNGQRQTVVTDASGRYTVFNVQSGTVTVRAELAGFATALYTFSYDQRSRRLDFPMEVSGITETVQVQSAAPVPPPPPAPNEPQMNAPSVNVQNLQRRAAGVLPVRIDVPRAGASYRFVKPLVVDEETSVSFRYRRK